MAAAMKGRCPYCREVSEWGKDGLCPACGKAALPPGFFGNVARRGARQERAPAARPSGPALGWMVGGGLWRLFSTRTPMGRCMLAIAVVAVLGATLAPPPRAFVSHHPKLIRLARNNLGVLRIALERFREDCGRFPSTADGLGALLLDPHTEGWKGPYILNLRPDPWGFAFRYVSDGTSIELSSIGADGLAGTADDLYPPGTQGAPQEEPAEPVAVTLAGAAGPTDRKAQPPPSNLAAIAEEGKTP